MDSRERISTFKIYISQTPHDPFPRYGLAMEYRSNGQIDKAQAIFDDLVRHFPDYVPTYLMAGNNLLELGRRDDAADVFRKGVEVSQRKRDAHAKSELLSALSDLE